MSQQTITNEQWAAAETNPYRTPEEDLKLWEKYQPKKYAEAKKLLYYIIALCTIS